MKWMERYCTLEEEITAESQHTEGEKQHMHITTMSSNLKYS